MQVNNIQSNNGAKNFKAKLKIDGEIFYGEVFEGMFDKASKIGTDKDVIDIKYVGYFTGKSKKTGLADKFSSTFVAKYLPKGNKSGSDKVRMNLADTSRFGYREKAKAAAQNYVDDLFKKYSKVK